MKRIKENINNTYVEITWFIAKVLLLFVKKEARSKDILLVPAANLNGGFGEDIMIASFITNFANGNKITILTGDYIVRKDYDSQFKNITYVAGFHRRTNYIKMLKLISKHALVYVIGADIMDGTYKPINSIYRLRLLTLAHKLDIQTQISGFSVSKKIFPEVKKTFLEISAFMSLKSRDIESYNRMKEFIPSDRLILTNDIAFICPDVPGMYKNEEFSAYEKWTANAKAKGKLLIGVCPNSIQANKLGLDVYEKDFSLLLNHFSANVNVAFVFLYHDKRPLCGRDTDSTISKHLYDAINKTSDCFYTDEITNGVQLKGYISLVDFTVTGRMHLGISGMTYNKPMFGVAYANKFEGMVKLFDIDPATCLVDYDKLENAEPVVKSFIRILGNYENKIKNNIDKVKADTLKNFVK